MVPASLIILVVAVVAVIFWIEDRRELRRVKRDVRRLYGRVERLEGLVASTPPEE